MAVLGGRQLSAFGALVLPGKIENQCPSPLVQCWTLGFGQRAKKVAKGGLSEFQGTHPRLRCWLKTSLLLELIQSPRPHFLSTVPTLILSWPLELEETLCLIWAVSSFSANPFYSAMCPSVHGSNPFSQPATLVSICPSSSQHSCHSCVST